MEGTITESAEGILTRALTLVTMDCEGVDAVLSKLSDDAIASVLGTAEYKHLIGALFLDNVSQESALVAPHDKHQRLFYGLDGGRFGCDGDAYWIVEHITGQFDNRLGYGGTE